MPDLKASWPSEHENGAATVDRQFGCETRSKPTQPAATQAPSTEANANTPRLSVAIPSHILPPKGLVGQMQGRIRGPGWLAAFGMVVIVAIALLAGYFAAASGWIQIGRNHAPSPTPLASLQDIIDQVQSSAVTIDATKLDGSFVASGFVSASGGVVLTNAHVVAHSFRLVVLDREGNKYQAHVIGLDTVHDVAAVKAIGLDRPPLRFATGSAVLRAGTEIYVVGNPGGTHPNSVLRGVVSATGLDITVQGVDYHGLYQLDTSNVVPGNSGSPIITSDGKVVGMDQLGDVPNVAATRFAYAIPVATFRQEAADWATADVRVAVDPKDLPWQTDPKQAVVQLRDLYAGYARSAEGPTQFSGSGQIPPSDEVTFVLPASGARPSHRIFSRVIVYTYRVDANKELSAEHTQLIARGASEERQAAPLGELSYVFTQTVTGDGTTTVTVIWRDRNVLCRLQLDGLTGSAAVEAALALANGVQQHVAASPTVNPDAT